MKVTIQKRQTMSESKSYPGYLSEGMIGGDWCNGGPWEQKLSYILVGGNSDKNDLKAHTQEGWVVYKTRKKQLPAGVGELMTRVWRRSTINYSTQLPLKSMFWGITGPHKPTHY